jgi:hypothetical protein
VWLGGLAGPGALPFRRLFLFLGPVLGPPHWQRLELASEPLMVTWLQVCPVQTVRILWIGALSEGLLASPGTLPFRRHFLFLGQVLRPSRLPPPGFQAGGLEGAQPECSQLGPSAPVQRFIDWTP